MAHGKLYTKLLNSKEWRELRIRKLRANPLCEMCQKEGYVVPARVVHHITEVESGRTEAECRQLCYNWNNLMALCREHHHKLHENIGTWKKENHQQREKERLAQWISKHGG